MEIIKELMPECFLLKPTEFIDERGIFVKTYHKESYKKLGINFEAKEEFYTVSNKNVVRGMHFQLPPHDQAKVVYCPSGAITDVLLDLRKGSSYDKSISIELSDENRHMVLIPKGIAHGFIARVDRSFVLYKTSEVHNSTSDFGISWDSFGFNWGSISPILSPRDGSHLLFEDFKSPF